MTPELKIQFGSPPVAAKDWDDWQLRHGNAFHATAHVEALASLGWQPVYGAAFRGGELVATLTGSVRRVPGRLGSWSPFAWVNVFAEPVSREQAATAQLVSAFAAECRRQGVSFIQTSGATGRWHDTDVAALKAGTRNLTTTPIASLEIDLSATEEALWAGVHSKHRNAIRSAEKAGVRVEARGAEATEAEIENFYQLLARTLNRGGAEVPPKPFIMAIARNWLRAGFAELFIAFTAEGIPVSSALVCLTSQRALYWLGASEDKEKATSGTGNLVQWRAIQAMKARGVRVYDVGTIRPGVEPGSKLEHIQKFKERFGGRAVPCALWTADLNLIRAPLLRKVRELLRSA